MKIFYCSVFFLLVGILNNHAALALGVDGGGGKGVRCGHQVMTLDLYEARKAGLILLNSTYTLMGDLKTFGPILANYLSHSRPSSQSNPELKEFYAEAIGLRLKSNIIDNFVNIAPGTRLPSTTDATILHLDPGCELVQIAIYDDRTQTILRDLELWNKLPTLEQAALVIHEDFYARARRQGVVKSDEARKVIGELFSTRGIAPMFEPLWGKARLVCSASSFDLDNPDADSLSFNLVDAAIGSTKGVQVYFESIRSGYVSSRTTAFISNISLKSMLNGQNDGMNFQVQFKNHVTGEVGTFILEIESRSGNTVMIKALGQNQSDLTNAAFRKGACRYIP